MTRPGAALRSVPAPRPGSPSEVTFRLLPADEIKQQFSNADTKICSLDPEVPRGENMFQHSQIPGGTYSACARRRARKQSRNCQNFSKASLDCDNFNWLLRSFYSIAYKHLQLPMCAVHLMRFLLALQRLYVGNLHTNFNFRGAFALAPCVEYLIICGQGGPYLKFVPFRPTKSEWSCYYSQIT